MRERDRENEKKKKKNDSIIQAELFRLIESSLKKAVNEAMNDIFKDWQ